MFIKKDDRSLALTLDPIIAQLKGKRFVVVQELDNGKIVNVGLLKKLVSGDKLTERFLYQKNTFEYYPQFDIVFVENEFPEILSNDLEILRRILVVHWKSKFVNLDKNGLYKGSELKENQFQRDPTINSKIKECCGALMWLLLKHYYPLYKKQGLKFPKELLNITNLYYNKALVFSQFIQETMQKTMQKTMQDQTLCGINYNEINKKIISNLPIKSISFFSYTLFKIWYYKKYKNKNYPNLDNYISFLNDNPSSGYDEIHNMFR